MKIQTMGVPVMELLIVEPELTETVEHCTTSRPVALVGLAKGAIRISVHTHRLREMLIPGKWHFELPEPRVISILG